MWKSLIAAAPSCPELAGPDLAGLAKRAEGQLDELEEHRLQAAVAALAA